MGKVNSFLTSQQPELFENVSSTSSIVKSWNEGLVLREESLSDSEHPIKGLRTPQIGAICAIKAHWSINDNKPAIIVMPTGERVIIVTGCINVLVSRVSGTLTKYNSCIA